MVSVLPLPAIILEYLHMSLTRRSLKAAIDPMFPKKQNPKHVANCLAPAQKNASST